MLSNTLKFLFFTLAMALASGVSAQAEDPADMEKANPKVVIHTSMGDVTLELFADKAPKSVENFLKYVDSGFFSGTIFHRVIGHFMIQGGGFTQDYVQKDTRPPVENEADNGLENSRGTVAMARTNDPHSGTSQFFINVEDNRFLNHTSKTNGRTWGYAVFGKVVDGMDVVDEIRFVETGPGGPFPTDAPQEQVVIESMERVHE